MNKTFTIFKNSRNKVIIKKFGLKAIYQILKFCYIANILKLNKISSSKYCFLVFFNITLINKYIYKLKLLKK